MKRTVVSSSLVMLVIMLMLAGCQKATEKKPAPKSQPKPQAAATVRTLRDLAAKDPYDNGCVSCHKKEGDVDRSLPAYVKRISGHPEVRESTVNACYNCHEAQKNYARYKAFYRGIHKSHWTSETFYTKLKGQCYSCHTVEPNGVAGLKNYPLAGFRSALGANQAVAGEERTAQPKTGQPASNKDIGEQAGQGAQTPKQTQESRPRQSASGKTETAPGEENIPMPTP